MASTKKYYIRLFSVEIRFPGTITHLTAHWRGAFFSSFPRARIATSSTSLYPRSIAANGNGIIMISRKQNESVHIMHWLYIHVQMCACRLPHSGKVHECLPCRCVGVNLQFIRTRVVSWPPQTEGRPQRDRG